MVINKNWVNKNIHQNMQVFFLPGTRILNHILFKNPLILTFLSILTLVSVLYIMSNCEGPRKILGAGVIRKSPRHHSLETILHNIYNNIWHKRNSSGAATYNYFPYQINLIIFLISTCRSETVEKCP